jgi:hypothetical protein
MELLITAFIAFYLGWKISSWVSALSFREILKELKVSDQQLEKLIGRYGLSSKEESSEPKARDPEEITIKVEQHQGVLYAFRIENDEFLGQGKTRDELVEGMAKRFKNVRFTVPENAGAELLKNDA